MTANRINKDHVKKSIIVRESNKRIKNNNQYAVIMKLGFDFSYLLIVYRIYYNSFSFTRYTSDLKDDLGQHDTDISKIGLPRLAKKPSGIARIGIALLLCEITINPTQVNLTV